MFLAQNWKDYEVIDTSGGEKLERWGKYILVRPDPQVIWNTPRKDPKWRKINARYHRSSSGGGDWEFIDLPKQWTIGYSLGGKELTFHLKPFSFKHTGLFPEQAVNWEWFSEKIRTAVNAGRQIKVLNLFAYTGGATLAAASAGASVTHVDASKGGELWKMEDNIHELVALTAKLLNDKPLFYLINSYTTGLAPAVLTYLISVEVASRFGGHVESGEVGLPVTDTHLVLPCGAAGRWWSD